MTTCNVPACTTNARAVGVCIAHYNRRRLGISDDIPLRIYGDDTARFWSKVAPAPALDCWTWTAGKSAAGYGQLRINHVLVYAHRWSYEHLRADIPTGLELDHLCENRACVNPWHLEPVTHKINMQRIGRRSA